MNRQNAKRARLSPDRSWVAFDGAPPGKQPLTDFDIQIVRLDGTDRTTLTDSDYWDIDAQWSPDGQRIFQKANYLPARPDVPPLTPDLVPEHGGFTATVLTPAITDKAIDRWDDIYKQLFR